MLRRCGSGVAVLALLSGLFAAPFTHAHHAIESVSDEHHPHGQTLVHAHATPHSHHDSDSDHGGPEAADREDAHDQIWSVTTFVFQQPVLGHAPAPGVLVFGEPTMALTSTWVGAQRPQPKAHGPPAVPNSPLRAPPLSLPAFA